jgi:hypothetical protein
MQEAKMITLTRAEIIDELTKLGINSPSERISLVREYIDYIDCHNNLFKVNFFSTIIIKMKWLLNSFKKALDSGLDNYANSVISITALKISNRNNQHASIMPATHMSRK